MPINILNTVNDLRQRLFGDKIRLGDTEDTELQTKAQVIANIQTELPENHPTQLDLVTVTIDGIPKEVATVVEPSIPSSANTLHFRHQLTLGTLRKPILDTLIVDFSGAKQNLQTVFFQGSDLPSNLSSQNQFVEWTGDPFSNGITDVNILKISYLAEPNGFYTLLIDNEVKEKAYDRNLVIYYRFEESSGNEEDLVDSSGYGNNAQACDGCSTGQLPNTVLNVLRTPSRVAGTKGNAIQWNHANTGNNTLFVGAFAEYSPEMIPTDGFTLMLVFKAQADAEGQIAGIASLDWSTGFGFVIRKLGIDGGTHDNKFEARIIGGTNIRVRLRSTNPYVTGTILHLAFVFSTVTGWDIYINGVLDASGDAPTGSSDTLAFDTARNPAFYIGARLEPLTITANSPKNGTTFDEYKYITRPLSAAEVLFEANRLGFGL